MRKSEPTYDPACYELAEYFLKEIAPSEHSPPSYLNGRTAHESACHDLALTIQKAVEDWFGSPLLPAVDDHADSTSKSE